MAKTHDLVNCHLCQQDASEAFITIEKNYDGETTSFIDICIKCFDASADDHLKQCVYNVNKFECVYCNIPVQNELGEIIMGNKNASGKYCAAMFHVFRYAFMHTECYDENIGL